MHYVADGPIVLGNFRRRREGKAEAGPAWLNSVEVSFEETKIRDTKQVLGQESSSLDPAEVHGDDQSTLERDVRSRLISERIEFYEDLNPLVVKYSLVNSRREVEYDPTDGLGYPSGYVAWSAELVNLNRKTKITRSIGLNRHYGHLFEAVAKLALRVFDRNISITFRFPRKIALDDLIDLFENAGADFSKTSKERFIANYGGVEVEGQPTHIIFRVGSSNAVRRFLENELLGVTELLAKVTKG